MNTFSLAEVRAVEADAHAYAGYLADMAVSALIHEATLTPKPGLVDLRGGGTHADMDWTMLCHSARTLQPCFAAMAAAGVTVEDPVSLRRRIGQIGRDGEAAMLAATGGVNTHRGAIWSLGLFVTAASREGRGATADAIAYRAGAIARLPDPFAPRHTGNKGEIACAAYSVGGARAQAQQGFPHVVDLGLPSLRNARREGESEEAARLNCLLAIMGTLDDTCVLSRGGPAALEFVQAGARRVLASGGVASAMGRKALRELESRMVQAGVSPGGAADLLAATLFLDCVAEN